MKITRDTKDDGRAAIPRWLTTAHVLSVLVSLATIWWPELRVVPVKVVLIFLFFLIVFGFLSRSWHHKTARLPRRELPKHVRAENTAAHLLETVAVFLNAGTMLAFAL